jgi:RimJ/RimL family protein N-acetyltransferase
MTPSGPAPTLRTLRLTLRALEAYDAARIAELAHDFDVVRMSLRMPFPYTLADAESFLERASCKDPSRDVTWAIDAGEGLVGVLGFFTEEAPEPELGYWLGRSAWGRGLATEAVGAALRWSAEVWGKPCILASVFVDNPASTRVLVKCGFVATDVVEPRWSTARGSEALARCFFHQAP